MVQRVQRIQTLKGSKDYIIKTKSAKRVNKRVL